MKNILAAILFGLFIFGFSEVKAQGKIEKDSSANIITVEQSPYFPSGDKALMKFISKKTTYPPKALTDKVNGLVVISYVVNVQGKISDFQILKSLTPETDAEALRVVKIMPDWIPGKVNGKPVNVRYNLPIRFTYTESKQKSKSKH